jgi:hypothetical protein
MKNIFAALVLITSSMAYADLECYQGESIVAYTTTGLNSFTLTIFSQETFEKIQFDRVISFESDETEINYIAENGYGAEAMLSVYADNEGTFSGSLSLKRSDNKTEDIKIVCKK